MLESRWLGETGPAPETALSEGLPVAGPGPLSTVFGEAGGAWGAGGAGEAEGAGGAEEVLSVDRGVE